MCHPIDAEVRLTDHEPSTHGTTMAVTADQKHIVAGPPSELATCDSELLEVSEPFEDFYRRDFRSVAGLAYALCGSTGAAEDITQDAFLAALRQWDSLRNPGAWVRKTVANRSVSQFRRRASETKALFRLGDGAFSDVQLPEHDDALWGEVRRLPKRQRQVLALRYIDGNSIGEIASLLGLSDTTVKTHLQRGKQTLNDRLKDA